MDTSPVLAAADAHETDAHETDAHETDASERWLRFAILVALISAAAALRLAPHWDNFTPLGAIALFGGAAFRSRGASVLLPLAVVFLTDLLIGVHVLMPFVYACLLFNVWLGSCLKKHLRPVPLAGATLLGAVVFFVTTNFACWVVYEGDSLAGLARYYVMGLPYFASSLAGDATYGLLLFGGWALAERYVPALRPATERTAVC
ncbi:DUF6580 family putative transport protein [Lignipirellula cremea]|uniref:Uncharacterized protein n=1 Tax=Lignipirellula cremea TaxID=2528010 RepID=A0A518DSU6_9BACT|nr:DUF6580 family putative transport protein [Lignipirellula cremea]QDU94916.1 hypothetical protein Pla8534_27240 [Lignipirellula cremea]